MNDATLVILLVDHGSRREEANAQLETLAVRVRAARPDLDIRCAHLEIAPPSVAETLDACAAEGVREVLIHPFFLAPGRHTSEDLPRLAREAGERNPGLHVRLGEVLGVDDIVTQAVLARINAGLGTGD